MTYTGALSTADLDVLPVSVGAMDNNAYLLRCRLSGAAVLVDAAAEPETLLTFVRDEAGDRLGAVVTTHRHADHWGALAEVVQSYAVVTMAGRPDAEGIAVPTARLLDHGDVVAVGAATVEVVALPGHTPGSIALVLARDSEEPVVLTGDAIFPGGIGRTTSPEAFTSAFDAAVREVFDRLPDATRVLPGHGRPTTLGVERPALPQWRARGW